MNGDEEKYQHTSKLYFVGQNFDEKNNNEVHEFKIYKKVKWKNCFIVDTCSPTRIFLVRAHFGNTACTCGTADDDNVPPSGPTACTSCLIRDTTAK